MRLSKAWCSLFGIVGAGLGAASYLANQGSERCQSATCSVVNTILDTQIRLSGLNTSITIFDYPFPIPISLGDIDISLRHALSTSIVDTLSNLPKEIGIDCQGVIWEQAIIALSICAGVSGVFIYAYKKMQALEKTIAEMKETMDEQGQYRPSLSLNS